MKLTDFENKLKALALDAEKLPKGAYANGIKNLLTKAAYKFAYIKRDEELKTKRGKEFFEATEKVTKETVVKTEPKPKKIAALDGIKKPSEK